MIQYRGFSIVEDVRKSGWIVRGHDTVFDTLDAAKVFVDGLIAEEDARVGRQP